MKLDQALKKIGVQVIRVIRVIRADSEENQLVLHMRVDRDPEAVRRWKLVASKLVLAAEKGAASGSWSAEIAKVLFAQGSTVKFIWRATLSGNVKTAQRIFGDSALQALRSGGELNSFPLIGNENPPFDPARGKLKGGHPLGAGGDSMAASQAIAMHFTPGMT